MEVSGERNSWETVETKFDCIRWTSASRLIARPMKCVPKRRKNTITERATGIEKTGRPRASSTLRNRFVSRWTAFVSFSSSAACGYLLHRLIEPHDWFGLVEFGIAWTIPAAAGVYLILFLSAPQQARVTGAAMSFVRSRRAKPSAK